MKDLMSFEFTGLLPLAWYLRFTSWSPCLEYEFLGLAVKNRQAPALTELEMVHVASPLPLSFRTDSLMFLSTSSSTIRMLSEVSCYLGFGTLVFSEALLFSCRFMLFVLTTFGDFCSFFTFSPILEVSSGEAELGITSALVEPLWFSSGGLPFLDLYNLRVLSNAPHLDLVL